ncbi:hypothetical protein SOASR030_09670 [Leminorella grimontii]|uniref:Putative Se/S carrier protein-like domain-containing protein n=1 Tax=Leminorella grimontii TaxID=82981 RepID=A0AAV5MYC0_9GAMM|nr:DUF3343 domain-containing protein [Leminorella grimontii]KFC95966.1 hypothetical protein GLGR_1140 [Leminorella grimontii ATCC 33999 = DSM 5078]GKX54855.1 hypothetical protein SOASR030_09670 [Leminorella grimontii]VFS58308.1 Protein of uncharacterised function (DUF3343) [Leminorella grimontii]
MKNNTAHYGYLFLFHTPLGIIQLKKALAAKGLTYSVIDAPRALTAECGMAVKLFLPDGESFLPLINEQVNAVYLINDDKPVLKWEDES